MVAKFVVLKSSGQSFVEQRTERPSPEDNYFGPGPKLRSLVRLELRELASCFLLALSKVFGHQTVSNNESGFASEKLLRVRLGRCIWPLHTALRSGLGFGSWVASLQCRSIVLHCRLTVRLQVENPSQINMGPSQQPGLMRDFQGTFEIISSASHVLTQTGSFGQYKKSPPGIFPWIVQGLFGELLCRGQITSVQLFLSPIQYLLCVGIRCLYHVRSSPGGEFDVLNAFLLLTQINVVEPIGVGVLQSGGSFLKLEERIIKITSENKTLLHGGINGLYPNTVRSLRASPETRLDCLNERFGDEQGYVALETIIHRCQTDLGQQRRETLHRGGTVHSQWVEHVVQIGVPNLVELERIAGRRYDDVIVNGVIARIGLSGCSQRLEKNAEFAAHVAAKWHA